AAKKLHWKERSELRHTAKEEAYFRAYNKLDKPFERATIEIFVTAGDKRRRSLRGFQEACEPWIGGLITAGILKNSSYFCVPNISVIFQGVSKWRVTILITEIEEGNVE
ncbi:hypothetical protein LCGC14_1505270, partial [marine sediment metagenome]